MKKFVAILLLAASTNCSGVKIKPDPSPLSAIQANYPTAEFNACGKLWHGLGVCSIVRGKSLSSLNFSIQGYYEGSVRIDSKDCEISKTVSYKNNGRINGGLSGTADKSCVVTFTVSPTYPKQQDSTIVVSGFRGSLRVKVLEPKDEWEGTFFRFPVGGNKTWDFSIGETNAVNVYMTGCGKEFNKQIKPSSSGRIKVPIHEAVLNKQQTCVIEGVVQSPEFDDLLFTVHVARYASTFNPLPEPIDTFDGKKLTIKADNAVSIVSVGDKYEISNEGEFAINSTLSYTVRAITTKGRSALGVWSPSKKEVVWILR